MHIHIKRTKHEILNMPDVLKSKTITSDVFWSDYETK